MAGRKKYRPKLNRQAQLHEAARTSGVAVTWETAPPEMRVDVGQDVTAEDLVPHLEAGADFIRLLAEELVLIPDHGAGEAMGKLVNQGTRFLDLRDRILAGTLNPAPLDGMTAAMVQKAKADQRRLVNLAMTRLALVSQYHQEHPAYIDDNDGVQPYVGNVINALFSALRLSTERLAKIAVYERGMAGAGASHEEWGQIVDGL